MMMYLLSVLLGVAFVGLGLVPLWSWDKGRRSLLLGLRSLWLHKLRSFLSVLGIIIGTAAVIALMAFGEGSMHDTLEDIKRQGATNIIVRSLKPPDDSSTQRRTRVATYGLTYGDFDSFLTIGAVTRRVPMRIFPQEVRHLDRMHLGRVVATSPAYVDVHPLPLAAGRFLIEEDDRQMRNVAVLGAAVADALFPFDDPLGRSVCINKHFYQVIGVARSRAPLGGGSAGEAAEDFNSDVYIPLQTCKVRFGQRIFIRTSGSRSGEQVQLHQVTLTIAELDQVRPAGDVVRDLLERRHHPKRDWAVTVPLDRLEEAERAKTRFTRLLVVIAGISLLVGGIGIMNIMLATVTERTREIGIRRALGAKRRDITLQFLVEAVLQTGAGGLAGVGLGLAVVALVPWAFAALTGGHLPARLHVPSIFLALAVAAGVGVLFGWYPARRAAYLDPIEALRHE